MLPSVRFFRFLPKKDFILRQKYCTKISVKPLGCTFFHPKVQFCMKNLVTVDYDYICRPRHLKKHGKLPEYKFFTDLDLEQETIKAKQRVEECLQFPPIIDATSDDVEVLSNDTSLDGHDKHHSKIIFIDLTSYFNNYERSIVVREPNGILRTANKNEKFRMNQMFFPENFREMEVPKMFEPKYLQEILNRKEYEHILDRACLQFEPDDEAFHKILIITYEKINDNMDFGELHKTRHFGSMAFYLAINKKINNLLQYFIKKEELIKAAYLIKLQHYVEKDLSCIMSMNTECNELTFKSAYEIVKEYISNPQNRLMNLEPHLSQLKNQKHEEEILKSHGVQ